MPAIYILFLSFTKTWPIRLNQLLFPSSNQTDKQNKYFQVSGLRYETQIRTLNQFPDTLLGDPSRRIRQGFRVLRILIDLENLFQKFRDNFQITTFSKDIRIIIKNQDNIKKFNFSFAFFKTKYYINISYINNE